MTLDKKVWREAVEEYRAWNEAEFAYRVRHAGEKTDEEKWREYCDLLNFGTKIKPRPSEHERRSKLEMWQRYLEQMQLFEARRKGHG